MALPSLPAWATVRAFFGSRRFLIPLGIVLFLLAIGGGTYYYLNQQQKRAVATAVEAADSKATIKSFETKDAIETRTIIIDRRFDDLQRQTIKDYANVRNTVQTAPVDQREAQAPALLIDTLNQLDRLRQARDASGVPDTELPVG